MSHPEGNVLQHPFPHLPAPPFFLSTLFETEYVLQSSQFYAYPEFTVKVLTLKANLPYKNLAIRIFLFTSLIFLDSLLLTSEIQISSAVDRGGQTPAGPNSPQALNTVSPALTPTSTLQQLLTKPWSLHC